MGKYSKLVGSIVGAAIGIAAAFGLPIENITPEVQVALVTVISTLMTFIFPANA